MASTTLLRLRHVAPWPVLPVLINDLPQSTALLQRFLKIKAENMKILKTVIIVNMLGFQCYVCDYILLI